MVGSFSMVRTMVFTARPSGSTGVNLRSAVSITATADSLAAGSSGLVMLARMSATSRGTSVRVES